MNWQREGKTWFLSRDGVLLGFVMKRASGAITGMIYAGERVFDYGRVSPANARTAMESAL